jgi:hypothetical protein
MSNRVGEFVRQNPSQPYLELYFRGAVKLRQCHVSLQQRLLHDIEYTPPLPVILVSGKKHLYG